MGQGGYRLAYAFAAICAAAAFAGPAAGATDCSTRLLADWQDGRIDRTYPVHCYREALASLPEDLQVYSTAQSDLTRALQAQLDNPQSAKAAGGGGNSGHVSPLLVLAVTAGLVLAGGSLAVIAR
jgi:uncharacterized protein (DUF3084 family)